jgi:hypothetical protein
MLGSIRRRALLLLFFLSGTLCAATIKQQDPASISLKRFRVEKTSLLDAILDLAQEQRVAVGIEYLLDHVLNDFSIPRMSVTEAGLALDRVLYAALHPAVEGWAGSYAGEISQTEVGPLSMHDVTVREALNRIVKEAGDAAWVVQVPPGNLDKLPSYGLWRIIQYQTPAKAYGALFRGILRYVKPEQPADGSR